MVRRIPLLCLGILSFLFLAGQGYPSRTPIIVPEFESYITPNSQYIVGQLIPLGFSPDGKFAYVVEPPDEACGCYFFELHIQDLKTDKDLYFKKVVIEGVSMTEWDQVWRQYGGQFEKEMALHGIRVENASVKPLPITVPAGNLRVRILGSWREFESGSDEKVLNAAYVRIGNEVIGEKRIAARFYTEEAVLGLEAKYYIKSPFEERVAILLIRIDRGWEGPPSTVNWEVVGARLDEGFGGERK